MEQPLGTPTRKRGVFSSSVRGASKACSMERPSRRSVLSSAPIKIVSVESIKIVSVASSM